MQRVMPRLMLAQRGSGCPQSQQQLFPGMARTFCRALSPFRDLSLDSPPESRLPVDVDDFLSSFWRDRGWKNRGTVTVLNFFHGDLIKVVSKTGTGHVAFTSLSSPLSRKAVAMLFWTALIQACRSFSESACIMQLLLGETCESHGRCSHLRNVVMFRLLLGGRNHFETEAALDVLAVFDGAQSQVLHHHGRVVLRRKATGVLSFYHKTANTSSLRYLHILICPTLNASKTHPREARTSFKVAE